MCYTPDARKSRRSGPSLLCKFCFWRAELARINQGSPGVHMLWQRRKGTRRRFLLAMPVDMQQAVEIMPLVAQECGESTVFLPSLGPNYRESVIQGTGLEPWAPFRRPLLSVLPLYSDCKVSDWIS
ncbi:hypothetical protein CPSG_04963 [Coccidioides posadasii str. Silveira]|uniref:Uncharacterized protein n=1 Tax=Coccidioides posadasii (strain RMSCC 757 / Silveira) TaxID=443226 RepID=E9D5T3_COCPS|nr:hypothetical protein CPSG_04963 [Coccidioides posadasii str. Silveira]